MVIGNGKSLGEMVWWNREMEQGVRVETEKKRERRERGMRRRERSYRIE